MVDSSFGASVLAGSALRRREPRAVRCLKSACKGIGLLRGEERSRGPLVTPPKTPCPEKHFTSVERMAKNASGWRLGAAVSKRVPAGRTWNAQYAASKGRSAPEAIGSEVD